MLRRIGCAGSPLLPERRAKCGVARRRRPGLCSTHKTLKRAPAAAAAAAAGGLFFNAPSWLDAHSLLFKHLGVVAREMLIEDGEFPVGGLGRSTSIIQGAPHGATLWLVTTCALSVALGALIYNLFSVMDVMKQQAIALSPPENRRRVIWGVDVSTSRFFHHVIILEAVQFAAEAHAGQMRKTGEPYVSHCIETALIVEHNLPPGVDCERYIPAMVAALLHDVIDDTCVDIDAIQAKFGKNVAHMVSKVSKLSQMNQLLRRGKRKGWAEYSPEHFQSLRKMIVDMVFEEPLVILVKLADRLHNMRTVYVLKREKQCSVAEETLEVWCTMAECLGWDALKSEMEDLCFAALEPDKYCALRAHLDHMWNLPTLRVVEAQADSTSLPANAMAPAPPLTIRARRAADAAAARRAMPEEEDETPGPQKRSRRRRSRSPASPAGSQINKATAAAAAVITDTASGTRMREPLVKRDSSFGEASAAATTRKAPPTSAAALDLGIRIVAATPPEGYLGPEECDVVDWQEAAAAAAARGDVGAGDQGDSTGGAVVSTNWGCDDEYVRQEVEGSAQQLDQGGVGSGWLPYPQQQEQVSKQVGSSGRGVAENTWGSRGLEGSRSGAAATTATAPLSSPAASPIATPTLGRLPTGLRTGGGGGGGAGVAGAGGVVKNEDGRWAGLYVRGEDVENSVTRDEEARVWRPHRSDGSVLYTEAMLKGDAPPPAPAIRQQRTLEQQLQRLKQEQLDEVGNRVASGTADGGGGSRADDLQDSMTRFLQVKSPLTLTYQQQQQQQQQQQELVESKNLDFLPQQQSNNHQRQQQRDTPRELLPKLRLPPSMPALPFLSRQAPPLRATFDDSAATSAPDIASILSARSRSKAAGRSRGTGGWGGGSLNISAAGGTPQQPQGQQQVSRSKPLTLQQQSLKGLVSTVVPFDSVNFKNTKSLSSSTRRGLEVLDQCAEVLFSEVMLRSSGGGLGLSIEGRLKSLHSVYRKMVRKGCSLAEVFDARALRVIVDDEGSTRSRDAVETCYKLVSTVHSIWKPVPHEFDDYISNPKPSGYQALHTAVKGPGGIPMEVQIKTASMHELAEYGAAAHWMYKENTTTTKSSSSTVGTPASTSPLPLPLPLPLSMEAPASAPSPSNILKPINPAKGSTLLGRVACQVSNALRLPQTGGQHNAQTPTTQPPPPSKPQVHQHHQHHQQHSSQLPTQPLPEHQYQQHQQQQQQRHVRMHSPPELSSQQSAISSDAPLTSLSATATLQAPGGGSSSNSSGSSCWPSVNTACSSSSSSSNRLPVGVTVCNNGGSRPTPQQIGDQWLILQQQQEQQQEQQQQQQGTAGAVVGSDSPEGSVSLLSASISEPEDEQGSSAPPPIFRGRGWVGQPVLRIAKDKLRYGVVVGSSGGGKRLLVAVKLGPTHPLYPTRIPDYSFYSALQAHVQEKSWNTPGRGDLVLRLEEFVLANNGRFHRKDHMGYVLPAETLTLLEGFEEEAEAMARSAQQQKLQQLLLPRHPAHQLQTPQQGERDQQQQSQAQQGVENSVRSSSTSTRNSTSLSERVNQEKMERFRAQMQEAHLRTQQLRKAIDWGRSAMGRYHPSGMTPSNEVAILIWPGGSIEHWPRGTTAGEVVRLKGIPQDEPRDVRASATSIAGGEDPGWLVRNSTFAGASYNVNNRLVPESTVLNDGDLVILSGEKMKI